MEIFIAWLFFSVLVGVFAQVRRNRNGFGWFMLSLLISPLFAFPLVAILREPAPTPLQLLQESNRQQRQASSPTAPRPASTALPVVFGFLVIGGLLVLLELFGLGFSGAFKQRTASSALIVEPLAATPVPPAAVNNTGRQLVSRQFATSYQIDAEKMEIDVLWNPRSVLSPKSVAFMVCNNDDFAQSAGWHVKVWRNDIPTAECVVQG